MKGKKRGTRQQCRERSLQRKIINEARVPETVRDEKRKKKDEREIRK
jgi:hypothetical protein